jgi:hypothetical protein
MQERIILDHWGRGDLLGGPSPRLTPGSVANVKSSGIFLGLFSLSQVNLCDASNASSLLLQSLMSLSELKTFRYVDDT